MSQKWSQTARITLLSIVTFIGGAAITGIIGNRSDALFGLLLEHIIQLLAGSSWSWIILALAYVVSLGIVFLLWHDSRGVKHKLQYLLSLNSSVLRLLPGLITAQDLDKEIHKLVQKLLRNAIQTYPSHISKGLLLLPDDQKEYLTIWDHYGWADRDSIDQTAFYIGQSKPNLKRGIAAEAFLKSEILVSRIPKGNGRSKSSSDDTIFINDSSDLFPCSTVCVPIVDDNTNDCIGVLCFDSKNLLAFDSPKVKEMLRLLGIHIAATITIYQEIQTVRKKIV